MTAHKPYLNNVTNASPSIILFCLFKIIKQIDIHNNSDAIGLSGTKIR